MVFPPCEHNTLGAAVGISFILGVLQVWIAWTHAVLAVNHQLANLLANLQGGSIIKMSVNYYAYPPKYYATWTPRLALNNNMLLNFSVQTTNRTEMFEMALLRERAIRWIGHRSTSNKAIHHDRNMWK